MKKLFTLILFVFITINLMATHIIGGDLRVDWLAQNDYQIQVRVYRDCGSGNAAMPTSVTVGLYQKGTNIQVGTYLINNPVISQNLPIGDACYTPTSVCVDQGVFVSGTITIPDFGPGYYLSTQLYARNNIITNLTAPGSTGMTFYAEIPDPALGQNSSPDFGSYPFDAYLCVTGTKDFNFNVIDADGDSLVYSLVEPLASIGTANGSQAGSGAYPYYPSVNWAAGYSLANICGGVPPMSINSLTGLISASPNAIGVYVFAVRVDEYRNGVKIGETRRDVQYASLACSLDSPPNIDVDDTVNVYVSDLSCVDLLSSDLDGADTIFTEITSQDLNLPLVYVAPDTLNGMLYYTNFNQNDTLWIPHLDSVNSALEGVGIVPSRFCWAPTCNDIDSTYLINIVSYSLGCAGSDTVSSDIVFQVVPNPAPLIDFNNGLDTVNVYVLNDTCFDIFVENSVNNDTLVVFTSSNGVDLPGSYIAPSILNGQYYYESFGNNDTLWFDPLVYNGPSSTFTSIGTSPIRYCWTPDCNELDSTFIVHVDAYTIGCSASDTSEFDFVINTIFDPSPLSTIEIDTVVVNALTESCFDILIEDNVTSDSLLVNVLLDGVNSNANVVFPQTLNGSFYYEDFQGQDTIWFDHFQYNSNVDNYSGTQLFPIRYCYTPSCSDLNNYNTLSVLSETSGCGAANTTQTNIVMEVIHEVEPELFVNLNDNSILARVGDTVCIDVLARDTVSADLLSVVNYSTIPNFNDGLVQPEVLNGNGYYTDFLAQDTVWTGNYSVNGDTVSGQFQIAMRYCWTPECQDRDSAYYIQTVLESSGCGASLFLDDTTSIIVLDEDVDFDIISPSFVEYTLNEETCFDVLAKDFFNAGETVTLLPISSSNFDFKKTFVEPSLLNGQYYYENFDNQDTLWISNYSNNTNSYSAVNYVPARYCFTPECEDLETIDYDIEFRATYDFCGGLEANKNINVYINNQSGTVNPIPNVFTPNGKDGNEYFTLSGTSDPCFDVMDVQIFNRWGRKVFESTDPLFKWDGKSKNGSDCAEGVYFVIIDGTYGSQYDIDGNRVPNVVKDQFNLYLMR